MLRVVRGFVRAIPGLAVAVLLGACASSPPSTQEIDQQKVAAINHAASRQGVKVLWISMPTKRIASPG